MNVNRGVSKKGGVQGVLLLGTFIIPKQGSDRLGTRLNAFALLSNSLPTSGIVFTSERFYPES